jgi:hypothetical protein
VSSRSPDQKVISVSLPQALLEDIDRRANSLDLPRSKYLTLLAQKDLRELGPVAIYSHEAEEAREVELTQEAYEFLKAAVPQLEEWDKHRREGTPMPEPGPAPSVTLQELWQRFLDERQAIMVHKWIESEKAGQDIGTEQAIRDWLKLSSVAPPPPPQ